MVCFAHESLWLRGWDFNGDWGSKNWYNHLIGCHFFIISLFHSISFLMQCKIVLTDGGSAQMLRYKQDHDIELVTAHYKNLCCFQTSCFVWLHSFLLRQRFCVRSFFSPRHRETCKNQAIPAFTKRERVQHLNKPMAKRLGSSVFSNIMHHASITVM